MNMKTFTTLTIKDLINLKKGDFLRFDSKQAGIYKDSTNPNIIYFCSYYSIILKINISNIYINNNINIEYTYIKGYATTNKQVSQFINMLMFINPDYQFNINRQSAENFKNSSVSFAA